MKLIEELFKDVAEDEKHQMVCENARRFYKLGRLQRSLPLCGFESMR